MQSEDLSRIKGLDAESIRRSLVLYRFDYFIREFWSEIIPEPLVWNWHISVLAQYCQSIVLKLKGREKAIKDLLINIPPGTTKSTIVTIMLPAWAWAIDPSLRILTTSYSSSLSTQHAIKSRDIIRSDKYKRLFPYVQIRKDQDNKTNYENTAGGQRYVSSVGGTITGFHGHLLIVDDPLNAQEAASEAKLADAEKYMDQTLSTRKVNKEGSPTILIMQRLHEKDPAGLWLKKRSTKIDRLCIPGVATEWIHPPELREHYDKAAGLLDPIRMSTEALMDLKDRLGSYGYAGQILQSPVPLEGALWQADWFKIIRRDRIPELRDLATDWDLAFTKNDRNSASAWVTAGKAGNTMYITGAGAVHAEFPQLINKMKTVQAPHYVEAMASGKSAVQTLKSQGIPAKEVQVQGGDKIARATLMSPYAEAGMVYIAEDVADFLLNDASQGLLKFPNGTHDDLNDALVQSINRILNRKKVIVF